jgi:membrane protease YdiL (CAAX protease family)
MSSMTLAVARDAPHGWVRRHPVVSFFALAYAITWLAWLPAVLGYGGDLNSAFMVIAQFGPALAALVVAWRAGVFVRDWARGIVHWRVAPRWYAVAIGLPVLVLGVEVAVFGLVGNPIDLSVLPGPLAAALPTLLVLTLLAGLGEEPGWRGFALPRLQARVTPVGATLLLGTVWALWHLPLAWVDPRFPHGFTTLAPLVLLALLTLGGIILYAFFYTWVYNATRSILLCMLLHGSFNTVTGTLFPAPFDLLQRETYVMLLVVQDITLLVAVAILVALTRGRLGAGEHSDRARAASPESLDWRREEPWTAHP